MKMSSTKTKVLSTTSPHRKSKSLKKSILLIHEGTTFPPETTLKIKKPKKGTTKNDKLSDSKTKIEKLKRDFVKENRIQKSSTRETTTIKSVKENMENKKVKEKTETRKVSTVHKKEELPALKKYSFNTLSSEINVKSSEKERLANAVKPIVPHKLAQHEYTAGAEKKQPQIMDRKHVLSKEKSFNPLKSIERINDSLIDSKIKQKYSTKTIPHDCVPSTSKSSHCEESKKAEEQMLHKRNAKDKVEEGIPIEEYLMESKLKEYFQRNDIKKEIDKRISKASDKVIKKEIVMKSDSTSATATKDLKKESNSVTTTKEVKKESMSAIATKDIRKESISATANKDVKKESIFANATKDVEKESLRKSGNTLANPTKDIKKDTKKKSSSDGPSVTSTKARIHKSKAADITIKESADNIIKEKVGKDSLREVLAHNEAKEYLVKKTKELLDKKREDQRKRIRINLAEMTPKQKEMVRRRLIEIAKHDPKKFELLRKAKDYVLKKQAEGRLKLTNNQVIPKEDLQTIKKRLQDMAKNDPQKFELLKKAKKFLLIQKTKDILERIQFPEEEENKKSPEAK